MLNYILFTSVVLFSPKSTMSQGELTAMHDYSDNGTQRSGIKNISEVLNEVSEVSQTSGKAGQFHDGYFSEPQNRAVRSDDKLSASFNGTSGIGRPDPRLSWNKTILSKSGKEQVHIFFLDKAREDAFQKTEAKEHPYSVVMRIRSQNGDVHVCSGTLVTVRWVLTAAHCLVDSQAVSLEVYAGIAYNIFDKNRPKRLPAGSQVKVTREFYHNPNYASEAHNVDYDIALVKFDRGFRITEHVKPIEMTSTPWNHSGYRNCTLTAFGRVRDSRDSPDDFIRKTQKLEAKKPCDCDGQLRDFQGREAASRYVCMRPVQDFGFCVGDSGGGLICDGELRAVVSYSLKISKLVSCKVNDRYRRSAEGEGMCGDLDTLNICQDVYASLSWIKKNAFSMNASSVHDATRRTISDNAIYLSLNFKHWLCFILFGLSLRILL